MNKRKLILSTGNKNKVIEIKHILEDLNIEVLTKKDIGLGNLEVVEDGTTLEENSVKKAKALAEKTDYMVLADDSGLFVDILGGEPGVHSSRYAGEDGNDRKNNLKLLKNLEGKTGQERNASFKAVMALITEDKKLYTVEGECKGSISLDFKGSEAFGYDPIFIPEGHDMTFGELGPEVKDKISHRARALENLKETLINIFDK